MSLLDQLVAQRHDLSVRLYRQLEGRRPNARMSKVETRAVNDISSLTDRIQFLETEEKRGDVSKLRALIGANSGAPKMKAQGTVYRKAGRYNYLSDLARHSLQLDGTGECRSRLMAHADEVRTNTYGGTELRDLSRTDGDGGYFVPPAWLTNEWIEYARPGQPLVEILNKHELPGGTDSINVPKLLTGTATAIQTADNQPVFEQDLTDTYITSPVRTIAGQQSIALQLIDQSPIDFTDVVLQDLASAHAVNLDTQVLYGSGSSGQLLGLSNTAGINTVAIASLDIQGFFSALANGYQKIVASRFRPPTHILLHPRRWAWALQLLDDDHRPLIVPRDAGAFNAAGISDSLEAEGPVGTIFGIPVILDSNITTTAGVETPVGTEDVAYLLRAPDITLYQSGIRARVSPETLQATLTVLISLWSYVAIGVRFPGSICEITGFTPPTF